MSRESTEVKDAYAPSDAMNFAANLRLKREALGLSQGDVAMKMQELGWEKFNQMTVSRIEQGKRRTDLSEARSLAAIVSGTIDEMVNLPAAVSAANSVFDAHLRCRAAVKGIVAALDEAQTAKNIAEYVVGQEVDDSELSRVQAMLPESVANALEAVYGKVQEYAGGGLKHFQELGWHEFHEDMISASGPVDDAETD